MAQLIIHVLRTLEGLGVPLPVLQKLAGHASPVITVRYTHVENSDLVNAVAHLPNISQGVAASDSVCTGIVHPRTIGVIDWQRRR